MTVVIGERLRSIRLERGRSLRAVAAAAGVSPSLLSQVETGKVEPSVRSLYAIVDALEVSLDTLLGSRDEPTLVTRRSANQPAVQRREDNPRIVMKNGVTWERLASDGGEDGIDHLLVTYPPGAGGSGDNTHARHEGVEYGFIIQGELTLQLEFDSYLLREGDSACFDSSRPHLYVNHTDEVTRGVWLVVGRGPESAVHIGGPIRSTPEALDALRAMRPPTIDPTLPA